MLNMSSLSGIPGIEKNVRKSCPYSLAPHLKVPRLILKLRFLVIQCVFFIELKVFVNLTYLYLSEIKKQGLIFSVGMGHLIICQKKFRSRQRIFI